MFGLGLWGEPLAGFGRGGWVGRMLASGGWVPQLITEVFVLPIRENCFCLFGRLVLSVAKPNIAEVGRDALAHLV